jgi:hypothetical protein
MKPKLPFGHPDTLRTGPFPCGGELGKNWPYKVPQAENKYHPRQKAWMQENKPLYYSGNLTADLPHMPAHLRSL